MVRTCRADTSILRQHRRPLSVTWRKFEKTVWVWEGKAGGLCIFMTLFVTFILNTVVMNVNYETEVVAL